MLGNTYFNYSFEIAALFIFAISIMIYFHQNFIVNKAHYIFLWLWFWATMVAVMDIVSVRAMETNQLTLFHVSNALYYEAQELVGYLIMMYALAPLWRAEKVSHLKKMVFTWPLLIVTILIATNYWTKALYYFDLNGDYCYGSWQIVVYIVPVLYYSFATYYAVSRKDVYNVHSKHALVNSFFLMMGFVVGGFFVPTILTRGFALALSMFQLIIVTMQSHAIQDPKTKILNKTAFFEWTNNLIYNEVPFKVVAIRIADYEVLVSTYGLEKVIEFGKELIIDVGELIPVNRGYQLQEDIICIIYENQTDEENKEMLKKLDSMFSKKFNLDGMDFTFSYFLVTFSFPDKFQTREDLRSLLVYLERMHRMRYGIMDVEEFAIRNLKREQEVVSAIKDALFNHRFEMFYQPIYNLSEKKYTSSEALIRLNNSSIGFIGPGEFIPVAERTGLMVDIGDYVVDAVFKFIGEHDLKALGIDYIELNLSTIQCLQRDFIQKLVMTASKYKVDPKQVCFEITETASNCAPIIFGENLQALHDLGYKLAIDDFGTGYGNLHRLMSMDFDIVKFDKDTTEATCAEPKFRKIFLKMIGLMHSMQIKIVNEGVETEDEYQFIASSGSDYIQGYYFSKPITEEEYLRFVEENNK